MIQREFVSNRTVAMGWTATMTTSMLRTYVLLTELGSILRLRDHWKMEQIDSGKWYGRIFPGVNQIKCRRLSCSLVSKKMELRNALTTGLTKSVRTWRYNIEVNNDSLSN